MNKLIFPIIALIAILTSCSGNADKSADLPGHLISGEVANAEGFDVKLVVFENGEERIIDSSKVADGLFEVQTETKELREYILLVGENEMPVVLFLDEGTMNVTIKGDMPGLGENYTIDGSEPSLHIKNYLEFLKPFYETEKALYTEAQSINPMDTASIQRITGQLDSISAIQREYTIAHIADHPNSPTNWIMLRELFPASGLVNFDPADLSYFQDVADGIREKYPYSEYPALIESDIKDVLAQIEQMKNPISRVDPRKEMPFEYAPEIVLNDVNGKPLALSSLKGKVVLIDFWASWCGPCRQENPNVVRVYNAYKDKGFTIFSVSLDEKKEAWLKAIEADNLTWPNHVSDLIGWKSSAAAAYGVNSIPATFLIDETGKLIATNLRGPQLEQKLQEIFN